MRARLVNSCTFKFQS